MNTNSEKVAIQLFCFIEGIIKGLGERWEIGEKPSYFTEWALNERF